MKNCVEISNLTIGYGNKVVLSELSAQLKGGKLTCLLGNNGMGKSTLLRTIAGFQPALLGEIWIQNQPLSHYSAQQLAHTIGVVLTEKIEMRHFTVTELVGLGRSPHTGFWGNLTTKDHAIIARSIETVGIQPLQNRQIQTLSDGEKQKVMIAKALAQQTPIILLDEPTAFLDYPSKVETLKLLAQLAHENNIAVLLSTHEIELALQLCDEIWLINQRHKLQTGTPETLFKNGVFSDFIDNKHIKFDDNKHIINIKK